MTPIGTPAPEAAEPQLPPDPHAETHRTLRNAGLVMASRVFHIAGATVFAVLVPRLMGPAVFGRYTLLTTVSSWFAQMTGMGAASMVTRRIPEYLARGDRAASDKLITNLLLLRSGSSTVAALAYLVVVAGILDEPDVVAAGLIAAAVPARILANLCFSIFLGRNEVAWWTAGELLMRWLTLAGVLGGALAGGLRGACAGFLLSGLIVLAVCLARLLGSLRWSSVDLTRRYLSPHLRYGTAFAAGHLLHLLASRSGAVIVRVATGNYTQVGFFGAALAVYLTGGQALMQLVLAFTPFLISRYHAGDLRGVRIWVERLLAVLVMSTVLANLAVAFIGEDLVPRVLGEAYAPVMQSLVPMTLTLTALAFGGVGRIVSLVVDRPRHSVIAAGFELVVSSLVGIGLAPWLGAPGAAIGLLCGVVTWAFVFWWQLGGELTYSTAPALKAVALGLPFAPLLLLRGGWATNALLLAASVAGYLALILRLHIVSPGDLQALRGLLRRRRRVPDPAIPLSEDA